MTNTSGDRNALTIFAERPERPRRGTKPPQHGTEYSTCVHEAGHVVVGYYLQGWLNEEGCRIDSARSGYTGFRWRVDKFSETDYMIFAWAGWTAERHWFRMSTILHPLELHLLQRQSEDSGGGDLNADWSTLWRTAHANGSRKPMTLIVHWSRLTSRVVRNPVLWNAILTVADALLNRRRLSRKDVEHLLDEYFVQLKNPPAETDFETRFRVAKNWSMIDEAKRKHAVRSRARR